jgi:non-specific serine/threonine protein kinase
MRDSSRVVTIATFLPGYTLSGFRIESQIGRGGMGVVFKATQLSLERQVALKVISPELASEERFRERFLREARLAASIDHPNLLPVYEAGEAEGTLFLAMRLVEGDSLAGHVRREGALPPERAVRLLAQLASALQAAHDAGLLHRDVKPHNVLLAGEAGAEHAYLCDFGLARPVSGGSLTAEGGLVGTASYAAPEQIRGEDLDPRCDLYSLACVLYECLTGHPPFRAEDELALCWAHLYEPAPLPGSVVPVLAAFDPVFVRAIAKDPEERFSSAAELVQAAEAALAAAVSPAAASAPRSSLLKLPRSATSFLGRERELQEVLDLLLDEGVRFLTLTGPGGTGKTRLALRAAEEAAPVFPDGVYWVGLASIRDPSLVLETIAQTLEAKQDLAADIGDKRLLVLLDNLEQVVDVAPDVAALLEVCPNLTLLVTSRELPRVQAEIEYPVPPLVDHEGIELFCRRSRLEPSEEIGELCTRLDNLPLAVELAAARTKVLSPAQILERLAHRLDLLTGQRDADPRQQTLRATIEWSYELLSPSEQELFARLSVFTGGCTLEAAEAICTADLDTLQSLVEKSLLRFSNERYWMLETMRAYALERLDAPGTDDELRGRYSQFFIDLADRGYADLRGRDAAQWLKRFEDEHDNFRAVLVFLSEADEPVRALQLTGALSRFWMTRGYLSEGRRWLESSLGATSAQVARPRALRGLALIEMEQGDLDRATAAAEEALQIDRTSGDEEGAALAMGFLADINAHQGDVDRAASLWEDCIELWRRLGRRLELAIDLYSLAWIARLRGDLAQTEIYLEESHEIFRELEDVRGQAGTLAGRAQVALDRGDVGGAWAMLPTVTELYRSIRFVAGLLDSLELYANVLERKGEPEAAAQLWGARYALGGEVGRESDHPQEVADHDEAVGRVRSALGDRAFEEAWALGSTMSLDEATDYALSFTR